MESLNPSGTGKDRAVRSMICSFVERGLLSQGGIVVEGSSGRFEHVKRVV